MTPTSQSVVVASVIALVAPALWFVVTGETYRTPVIEKSMFEKMTPTQVEEWKRANLTRVSLWEHAKGTPQFVAENWLSYLQAVQSYLSLFSVSTSSF